MGVYGRRYAIDVAVVVHRRNDHVEQVVPVRGQDVKSEHFAISLIRHGLEPMTS